MPSAVETQRLYYAQQQQNASAALQKLMPSQAQLRSGQMAGIGGLPQRKQMQDAAGQVKQFAGEVAGAVSQYETNIAQFQPEESLSQYKDVALTEAKGTISKNVAELKAQLEATQRQIKDTQGSTSSNKWDQLDSLGYRQSAIQEKLAVYEGALGDSDVNALIKKYYSGETTAQANYASDRIYAAQSRQEAYRSELAKAEKGTGMDFATYQDYEAYLQKTPYESMTPKMQEYLQKQGLVTTTTTTQEQPQSGGYYLNTATGETKSFMPGANIPSGFVQTATTMEASKGQLVTQPGVSALFGKQSIGAFTFTPQEAPKLSTATNQWTTLLDNASMKSYAPSAPTGYYKDVNIVPAVKYGLPLVTAINAIPQLPSSIKQIPGQVGAAFVSGYKGLASNIGPKIEPIVSFASKNIVQPTVLATKVAYTNVLAPSAGYLASNVAGFGKEATRQTVYVGKQMFEVGKDIGSAYIAGAKGISDFVAPKVSYVGRQLGTVTQAVAPLAVYKITKDTQQLNALGQKISTAAEIAKAGYSIIPQPSISNVLSPQAKTNLMIGSILVKEAVKPIQQGVASTAKDIGSAYIAGAKGINQFIVTPSAKYIVSNVTGFGKELTRQTKVIGNAAYVGIPKFAGEFSENLDWMATKALEARYKYGAGYRFTAGKDATGKEVVLGTYTIPFPRSSPEAFGQLGTLSTGLQTGIKKTFPGFAGEATAGTVEFATPKRVIDIPLMYGGFKALGVVSKIPKLAVPLFGYGTYTTGKNIMVYPSSVGKERDAAAFGIAAGLFGPAYIGGKYGKTKLWDIKTAGYNLEASPKTPFYNQAFGGNGASMDDIAAVKTAEGNTVFFRGTKVGGKFEEIIAGRVVVGFRPIVKFFTGKLAYVSKGAEVETKSLLGKQVTNKYTQKGYEKTIKELTNRYKTPERTMEQARKLAAQELKGTRPGQIAVSTYGTATVFNSNEQERFYMSGTIARTPMKRIISENVDIGRISIPTKAGKTKVTEFNTGGKLKKTIPAKEGQRVGEVSVYETVSEFKSPTGKIRKEKGITAIQLKTEVEPGQYGYVATPFAKGLTPLQTNKLSLASRREIYEQVYIKSSRSKKNIKNKVSNKFLPLTPKQKRLSKILYGTELPQMGDRVVGKKLNNKNVLSVTEDIVTKSTLQEVDLPNKFKINIFGEDVVISNVGNTKTRYYGEPSKKIGTKQYNIDMNKPKNVISKSTNIVITPPAAKTTFINVQEGKAAQMNWRTGEYKEVDLGMSVKELDFFKAAGKKPTKPKGITFTEDKTKPSTELLVTTDGKTIEKTSGGLLEKAPLTQGEVMKATETFGRSSAAAEQTILESIAKPSAKFKTKATPSSEAIGLPKMVGGTGLALGTLSKNVTGTQTLYETQYITGIGSKGESKNIQVSRLQLKQAQPLKVQEKLTQKFALRLGETARLQGPKLQERFAQPIRVQERLAMAERVAFKLAQPQAVRVNVRLTPRVTAPPTTRVRPPRVPIRPKIPPLTFPRISSKKRYPSSKKPFNTGKEKGYTISIRRGRKTGNRFETPLAISVSKEAAYAIGARKTIGRAAAQFKIVETGRAASPTNIRATAIEKAVFAPGKKPGTYIQKVGLRIISEQEKREISYKGAMARKKNKTMWGI